MDDIPGDDDQKEKKEKKDKKEKKKEKKEKKRLREEADAAAGRTPGATTTETDGLG
eukprot:gene42183-62269_t